MAKGQLAPREQGPRRGWLFGRDGDVLSSLHDEVDRLFDDFFRDTDAPAWSRLPDLGYVTRPRIDVAETDAEVEITAELPGLTDKDVEVTLSNGLLTIKGEKKAEKEEKGKNYRRMERSYGSFERVLSMPENIDDAKIKAGFDKGVLTIGIPKKAVPKSKVKKVAIKTK